MNPGMVMSPVASPTTTQPPPLPAPQTHHHHHPHSSPYHQQQHPYMVGNAAPGNGTMSSPTPGEFAAPHPIQQEDKLSHPATPTTTVNYMDAVAANDWNARSRMNSAGSLPPPPTSTAAAAAYFQHHQPTAGTLSSNASTNSAFSPTTPTTPYVTGARKYPDQQHHHPAQSS